MNRLVPFGPGVVAAVLGIAAAAPRADCAEAALDTLPRMLARLGDEVAAGDFAAAAATAGLLESTFSGEPEHDRPEVERFVLPRRAVARAATGDASGAADDFARLAEAHPDLEPGPLWFRWRQARALRAADRGAEADSVLADIAARAGREVAVVARLAQAMPPADFLAWAAGDAAIDPRLAEACALRLLGDELRDAAPGHPSRVAVGVVPCAASTTSPRLRSALLLAASSRLAEHGDPAFALEVLLAVSPEPRSQAGPPPPVPPPPTTRAEVPAAIVAGYHRETALADARVELPGADWVVDQRARAFLAAGLPLHAFAARRWLEDRGDGDAAARGAQALAGLAGLAAAGRWDRVARELPRALAAHGDGPHGPDLRFLAIEADLRRGDPAAAAARLGELVEAFPAARGVPRWRLRRGQLLLGLREPNAARAELRAASAHPAAPARLAREAALLAAVAAGEDGDAGTATAELEALRAVVPEEDPFHADVLHRLAVVRYAAGDAGQAIAVATRFLELAPDHAKSPEVLALRGDTRLAAGEALAAVADYARIPPEAGALHDHARFQAVRVYRALGRHDLVRRDLEAYLARVEPPPGRPAEAVLQLVESLAATDGPEAALARLLEETERRIARDAASGTGPLLAALERRAGALGGEALPLAMVGGFDAWFAARLAEASATSRDAEARLVVWDAGRKARRDAAGAESLVLDLAGRLPVDAAPPEALAAVGLALARLDFPSSRRWLGRLSGEWPAHPDAPVSLYARALDPAADGRSGRAALEGFLVDAPDHPLAVSARLRIAGLLAREGDRAGAEARIEEVLASREARGRPHAEATLALARLARDGGEPRRAAILAQRLRALHGAQGDLVAEAEQLLAGLPEDPS